MRPQRILNYRLRRPLRTHGLPDVPEVRRLLRLAWLNGFTFGAFEHRMAKARQEALAAAVRASVITRKK